MIGLADDRYDYKNYLLFQRPIKLGWHEDADAPHNGLCAECNGDVCYNGCKAVKSLASLSFLRSKTASSPWIFAALKFPNVSCSIAKKFSAICLASSGKFKCA